MLTKLTSKNQLTLPKAVVREFPGIRYFEVLIEKGCIVLRPARVTSPGGIRRKVESLGITERDIEDAVQWARRRR